MHEDIKIGALVKTIFQTMWQDLAFATKCSLVTSSSLFGFFAEFLWSWMRLQLVPCAVLAFFIHPRTTHLWVNRALWAFCVYLEAVSVLPQLRLMQNTRVTLQSPPLSLLGAILLYQPLSLSLLCRGKLHLGWGPWPWNCEGFWNLSERPTMEIWNWIFVWPWAFNV